MKAGRAAACLLGILFVATCGYLVGLFDGAHHGRAGDPSPSVTSSAVDPAESRIATLEDELDWLKRELTRTRTHEGELDALCQRLQERVDALLESELTPTLAGRRRPRSIQRIEQADSVFEAAVEGYDPEALIQLMADLLRFGEEGYEKLIEIFAELEHEEGNSSAFEEILATLGEAYVGRIFRMLADHHDEVLRFGLYVLRRDASSLPGPLAEFRSDFHHFAPLLIGLHDDRNPELELETVAVFREYYFGEATRALSSNPRTVNAIRALGQIHLDESTELLLELLGRAPPALLDPLITTLGLQGNPRALPALENLRLTVSEPKALVEKIDWAVERLR